MDESRFRFTGLKYRRQRSSQGARRPTSRSMMSRSRIACIEILKKDRRQEGRNVLPVVSGFLVSKIQNSCYL